MSKILICSYWISYYLYSTGVRIDLDEVEIRRTPICSQERVAFGRELYSSAFDCLSAKASSMLDINLAASEVIVECASMLLDVSAGHSLSPSDLTGEYSHCYLLLLQIYCSDIFCNGFSDSNCG